LAKVIKERLLLKCDTRHRPVEGARTVNTIALRGVMIRWASMICSNPTRRQADERRSLFYAWSQGRRQVYNVRWKTGRASKGGLEAEPPAGSRDPWSESQAPRSRKLFWHWSIVFKLARVTLNCRQIPRRPLGN